MFGKFTDGKFEFAPNPLRTEEYTIYNPRPEKYIEEGYLEVVELNYPTEVAEDKYYIKNYVERDGKIYGEWVEGEMPMHTPSLEERVAIAEAQITDTQLALCEVYEMLIG